jgi:hypothetical protein
VSDEKFQVRPAAKPGDQTTFQKQRSENKSKQIPERREVRISDSQKKVVHRFPIITLYFFANGDVTVTSLFLKRPSLFFFFWLREKRQRKGVG